jgi:hypothetical protein
VPLLWSAVPQIVLLSPLTLVVVEATSCSLGRRLVVVDDLFRLMVIGRDEDASGWVAPVGGNPWESYSGCRRTSGSIESIE